MKAVTLKNLAHAHAHAWLGIIISGVLMIVFFCGSMSFLGKTLCCGICNIMPQPQNGVLAALRHHYAVFKGDIPALLKTVDFYALPDLGDLAGVPADLTLIDVAVANAISRYPEQRVQFVNLFAPQDRYGQIEVVLSRDHSLVCAWSRR
jgi:hypothetical protein